MGVLVISCGLASLLGFAAQRASICNVRAVAEVISSGSAYMLASIGKTVLWVIAVTMPFFWLMPSASGNLEAWSLSWLSVAGGFVFGIGAAVNGACAISTMSRLADGQLSMLATLLGFVCGGVSGAVLMQATRLSPPSPERTMFGLQIAWTTAIIIALFLWALREITRWWRTRSAGTRLHELVLARRYRLSTAAMLIGLANGLLFLAYGRWGSTGMLQESVEALIGNGNWPAIERWTLGAAMLAGMVLSTWQRKSFRLEWQPRLHWLRNAFGGLLMGLGAAFVPGGNDTLVLFGIPSLSPNALPVYAAMTVGVAMSLLLMRVWLRLELRVECRGDVCITDTRSGEIKLATSGRSSLPRAVGNPELAD